MTKAEEIEIMLSSVRCPTMSVESLSQDEVESVNWKNIVRDLIVYVDLFVSKFYIQVEREDIAYGDTDGKVIKDMLKVLGNTFSHYRDFWLDFYHRVRSCNDWLFELQKRFSNKSVINEKFEYIQLCIRAFDCIGNDIIDIINNSFFDYFDSINVPKSSIVVKHIDEESNEGKNEEHSDEEQPPTYIDLENLKSLFSMDDATAKGFIDYCRTNINSAARTIGCYYNNLVNQGKARKRGKNERGFYKPLYDILKANGAFVKSESNFSKAFI